MPDMHLSVLSHAVRIPKGQRTPAHENIIIKMIQIYKQKSIVGHRAQGEDHH